MRARSAFFAGAGSVAILAIGWQAGLGTLAASLPTSAPVATGTSGTASSAGTSTAGNAAGSGTTGTASNTSSSPSAAASAPVAAAPAAPVAAAPAASGAADGTYSGQTYNTRYGTVQVNAVISGGKITDVVAVKLTDQGRQSVSISTQAAPMLRQEVLSSQSAKVSNIGGATYTTQGYLSSLQSALDSAGFTG